LIYSRRDIETEFFNRIAALLPLGTPAWMSATGRAESFEPDPCIVRVELPLSAAADY